MTTLQKVKQQKNAMYFIRKIVDALVAMIVVTVLCFLGSIN